MQKYLRLPTLPLLLGCLAVLFSILSLNITDLHAQQGTIATRIYSIALSPMADKVAVGYGSGLIEIISVNGQQPVVALVGHSARVTSLAWNSDGTSLASTAADPDNSVRIWNITRGTQSAAYDNFGVDVLSVAWSPDNSKVVVTSAESAPTGALLIDIALGTSQPLPFGTVVDITWSPDNMKIAVIGIGSVLVYDTFSSQRLLSYQIPSRTVAQRDRFVDMPSTLDWSNDGLQIAVGFGDGRVLVLNATTMQPLVWLEANDYEGSTIEFAAVHAIRYDSQNRLMTVSGDGTLKVWNSTNWAVLQTTQVAQNYTADFGFSDHTLALGLATPAESPVELVSIPTLSLRPPDDSRIIFSVGATGNHRVVSINSDGSDSSILVESYRSLSSVACSPDGQFIATNEDGIVVHDLENHTSSSITSIREIYETISWSPDGTTIGFSTDNADGSGPQGNIFFGDVDGSNLRQITQNGHTNWLGGWSSNGLQIIYNSPRGNQSYDIFVSNADGSNEIRLTQDAGVTNLAPSWSPTTNDILFNSDRDGSQDIYLMAANGTHIRRLTGPNQMSNWSPVWSPDGDKISFTSSRDGQVDLYVMNVDGSQVQRITNTSEREEAHCWITSPTFP